MGADNLGAGVQREDVAYEGLSLALHYDHVGNLNDGVLVRLGKDPFASRTLDVKGEDAYGRHLGPVALRQV